MAIRACCGSMGVTPNRFSVLGRNPTFRSQIRKVMYSTKEDDLDARKVFENNRFIEPPPTGWKERFIVICDDSSPTLCFEDFKQRNLKTFEEYREEHKKFYDDERIRIGYEGYCKGNYKSYLIEIEQINPGIIL